MTESKHVTLTWRQGLRFDGGPPEGPLATIDGDNVIAPGPMLTLLLAAASCSGSDVVVILEKMRVQLRELRIDVAGVRRDQEPRRYVAIHFDYHLQGEGLDQSKARRAIDLSLEKYCSVVHSLASDIAITYAVTLA
ncbi:MAG TPA: OsmC family protein [Gemmatimonadales bacterium]|jgi:putative redox protein|nr:OsmC family protein [Gemmatimonadales bacterium]